MRILFYSWKSNNESLFIKGLEEAGYEVIIYDKECIHYTRDMALAGDMIPFIHQNGIEAIASFNYFPIISLVCNTVNIPYYSWVYDCPHLTLYAGSVKLPCNHIATFDREMAEHFNSLGVNTIFHLPLSVDTSAFMNTISDRKSTPSIVNRYSCDVSFVGSLYTGKYDYFENLDATDEIKNETLELVKKHLFDYKKSSTDVLTIDHKIASTDVLTIDHKIASTDALTINHNNTSTDSLMNDLNNHPSLLDSWISSMEAQGLMLGEDYFATKNDLAISEIIEKKITIEERRILLSSIADTFGERFHLHTNANLDNLQALKRCNQGTVNYHTEMPLVFNLSKINLNISLRSIHSGIPLRVLDIMACGGFMLSNYQPELDEYFKDGEELVLFTSPEDAIEKIKYYLSHEQERIRIAEAGFKAVAERFSYRTGIQKLFSI